MAIIKAETAGSPAKSALRVGVFFLLGLGVGFTLAQLVLVRLKFWRMKRQGVPMMPYSLLLGHLPVLAKLTAGLPKDLHPNYIPQLVYENWRTLFPGRTSCPSIIYIDSWPLGPPTIFIVDPETGAQCIADSKVRRSHNTSEFIRPLTDGLDLVSMEGDVWKTWRSRFNPAFSPKNVTTLVPGLVEAVGTFADIVRRRAGVDGSWGAVFPLQETTTNLTIDIIGRAGLGMELNEQTNGYSKLRVAFMDQIKLCMFKLNIVDLIRWHSPWRQWAIATNRSKLRNELLPAVMDSLDPNKERKFKTIIDQAVKPFKGAADEEQPPPDPLFIDAVIGQLKIFMFAGHDSTATTLCWVLHIIARNPNIARKLRAEHDEVFGEDLTKLGAKLEESPHLLNSLPYTIAVIKESLRLYPAFGALREGGPHYQFVDKETGVRCPTDDCFIIDAVRSLSRAEDLWPRAREAIPERWTTTDVDDPLYPPKHAWRMFGNGPRVCIGQELAMTEMKLVVVFLTREFDLDCAWEEWDAMQNKAGPKVLVEGHRCYQTDHGTAHINDGMPVHARLRGRAS